MTEHLMFTRTIPAIPVEHRVDLVRSNKLPPRKAITSASVFVIDALDRTLMTNVDRPGRGWDVPGGHLEDGESAAAAAVRELFEESGLDLEPDRLSVEGWTRIQLLDAPPLDYRYPATAYMVHFAARLGHIGDATSPPAGSECTEAAWFARDDVERLCADPTLPLLHRLLLSK